MPPHHLKLIPLAFAGDPFQTLNPTGFDWDAVKANFHEKIILGIDKSYNATIEVNDKELSHNYRSNKDIVGLCNLIQLLRGILFKQKNLVPQKTWFEQDSNLPVYFNLKDPICEQNFKEQGELVVILPCQEGEEENYVKNDSFLNKIIENESMMRNFLSPMRAKGQEFSRVILYKFGSEANKKYPDLFDPLKNDSMSFTDRDSSLPKRYFLNRLYVAVSRAKNHLIILDDDEGINTLWNNKLLKDFDKLINSYKGCAINEWTSKVLNYVIAGNKKSWSGDRDNPYDLAKAFEAAGDSEQDTYKLQLAENNYLRANMPQKAKECRAKRLEIIDQCEDAGVLYEELSLFDKALFCYWKLDNYDRIVNNIAFSDKIYYKAAKFKKSQKTKEDIYRWIACKIKYSNYLSKIDTPNTTAKQNYSETVAKHRIDAEEICKKYLKINPYSIPLNPEIKYSDEEENAFLSSIEIAKIPKETKDGILELYNQKWNVEKIARSYNLNEKMVEKVVKFYKQ